MLDLFEQYLPLLRTSGIRSKEMLLDEADVLQHLAKVITGRFFNAIESDCRVLFGKFGIDGLRLVQAGLLTNPSIPRVDRQANSEAARRLFESLSSGMKYDTTPREEYAGFDSAIVAMNASLANKSRGGFWSKFSRAK